MPPAFVPMLAPARAGNFDDVDEARYERAAAERLQVSGDGVPHALWDTMQDLALSASRLRARANLVEYRAERMSDENAVVEGLAWVARLRRQAEQHESRCHQLLTRAATPADRRHERGN